MFDEYVKEPKSLDTLTLEQVSERIHSTNERTTRRWLEECGIKIYRFARKSFVYQVEVESESLLSAVTVIVHVNGVIAVPAEVPAE